MPTPARSATALVVKPARPRSSRMRAAPSRMVRTVSAERRCVGVLRGSRRGGIGVRECEFEMRAFALILSRRSIPIGRRLKGAPRMRTEPQHWAFFMLVNATRAWLDLPLQQRIDFVEETLKPLLRPAEVRLRYFDSEYFHAKVSDVLLWETVDPAAYQAVIEGLRDTEYWNRYLDR